LPNVKWFEIICLFFTLILVVVVFILLIILPLLAKSEKIEVKIQNACRV